MTRLGHYRLRFLSINGTVTVRCKIWFGFCYKVDEPKVKWVMGLQRQLY